MSEQPEIIYGYRFIEQDVIRALSTTLDAVEATAKAYEDTLNAIAVLHKADVGRMGLAICTECSQSDGEPVFWPCDTVRLIAELVEADA